MRGAIRVRIVDSAMTILLGSLEHLPKPTMVILDDLQPMDALEAARLSVQPNRFQDLPES